MVAVRKCAGIALVLLSACASGRDRSSPAGKPVAHSGRLASPSVAPPVTLPARRVLGAEGLVTLCEQLRDEERMSFPGTEVERAAISEAHRARRMEASAARYVVELPSAQFGFREFDSAASRLTLEAQRGFSLGEGAELYLAHGVGADQSEPGHEPAGLAFAVPAPMADQIEREHQAGRLRLALVFRPARSQVRGELCMRQGAGQIVKMAVDPLAAYLVDRDGRSLARSEGEEFADVVASGVPVDEPGVTVGKPSRQDRGEVPSGVGGAVERLGPELLPCYQTSLKSKPQLRGTLVVGAALTAQGRLESASMEVSSVADERLVACVLDRLSRVRLAAVPSTVRLSIPIRFGDRAAAPR